MKGLSKLLVVLLLASSLTGCTEVLDDIQNRVGPQGPGSNHEAYLTGERKLVVELDHSPGAKWDTNRAAPDDFERQLERITDKDVEIRTDGELPSKGEDYVWSTSELRGLHDEHQDLSSDDEQVVMHALFVDGDYEDPDAIGVAFAPDVFAIFSDKIDKETCRNGAIVCSQGAERYEVMRSVSIHEAGHLLGLVNLSLEMQTPREDPDHPGHSDRTDSVMFWKIEKRDITDLFSRDTIPYEFDRHDMADAKAQRNGSR